MLRMIECCLGAMMTSTKNDVKFRYFHRHRMSLFSLVNTKLKVGAASKTLSMKHQQQHPSERLDLLGRGWGAPDTTTLHKRQRAMSAPSRISIRVARIFQQLDVDRSGTLNGDELDSLLYHLNSFGYPSSVMRKLLSQALAIEGRTLASLADVEGVLLEFGELRAILDKVALSLPEFALATCCYFMGPGELKERNIRESLRQLLGRILQP